MFGTIRKHQTWLWGIIITLTIISFVIFFSPYTQLDQSGVGPADFGSINGKKIIQEEYRNTEREVLLRHFFMTGKWPDEESKRSGFDPMRETYYRLLLIRKQEEMGIHISSDVLAQVARQMLQPFERQGITSPAMFVEKVLKPRMDFEDLERFVRHEMGIQELISTVAMSGKLITPEEAKSLYIRENEEVATTAVFFSASNYLDKVTETPEAISMFYSNRLAEYRIPERLQVSYVRFDITNFMAEVDKDLAGITNLNERIAMVYQQRGTNFYPNMTAEEAKPKIHEEMRKELGLLAARKKASEFASALYDREPMRAENLAALAKEQGLPSQVSTPFDRDSEPKELNVGPGFVRAAFSMTNEPFAGPLLGEDAVYVIAPDKRLPSEAPTLDQVRERVVADYKFSQAATQARIEGMTFSQTISNGLATGKSFPEVCAEAKVKPVDLPKVAISTRSLPEVEERLNLNHFKQIAFSTNPGMTSPFQPTLEGGVVVHVKSKEPPSEAKLKAELPTYISQVRQTRQNEAFNQWFQNEAKRGLVDTELFRQQQPQPGAPGGQQPPPPPPSKS